MEECDVIQRQLGEFVDGELAEEDAAAVLLHSGSCRQCRGYLASSLRVRAVAVRLFSAHVPRALDERVLSIAGGSVAHWSSFRTAILRRRVAMSYPIAAILSVVFIVFGAFVSERVFRSESDANRMLIERSQPQMLPAVDIYALPKTDVRR